MADVKRLPAVIYMDRNRMWYYTAGISNIIQLDFPADILSDLEILNKEKLAELIKSFVEGYKLQPANITLVLAPTITFEKDFPEGLPVEIEGETKSFLNFVPFEETYNKTFKLGKTIRCVAVNQELCNDIRAAFGDQQFLVTAIVPYSIIQQTMPELANNLDLVYVLNHIDSIRQHSLTTSQEIIATAGESTAKNPHEPQSNKRIFLLGGVFAVLLLVLGFVVYTQIIAPPTPIKSTSIAPTILPSAPTAVTPTVSATPAVTTSQPKPTINSTVPSGTSGTPGTPGTQ